MINIDPARPLQPSKSGGALQPQASTPEEAAKQFEEILVRQFVSVMTKGLFEQSLSGDEGPGWIKGQQDTQRDIMTNVLTEHLVDSGAIRISDILLRQWKVKEAIETPDQPEQEPS